MNKEYTITSVQKRPDLYQNTIKLIENCFNYENSANSFEDDFTLLISAKETMYIMIDSEDKVIAHVGLCPRSIKLNQQEHRIALIGGISVANEYRGQGLFHKIFQYVLDENNDHYCLFILWSDLNIYKKHGFFLGVGQYEYEQEIDFSIPLGFNKTQFVSLNDEHKQDIKSCFEKYIDSRMITLYRTEKIWQKIFNIKDIELYIKENDGKIIEYFCRSKGRDLQGVIHEAAVNDISRLSKDRIWLPEYRELQNTNTTLLYMSYLKIGNKKLFQKLVEEWSNFKITINKVKSDQIVFEFNNDQYQCSSEEFVSYIWGPNPMEELRELNKPFYILGTDSV